MATQRLAGEDPGQSLQSSDLVHEAYLRLVGEGDRKQWDGRRHFFAAAEESMRRILVENARRKNRLKHGGGRLRLDLDAVGFLAKEPSEDLEAIDEALTKLAATNLRRIAKFGSGSCHMRGFITFSAALRSMPE